MRKIKFRAWDKQTNQFYYTEDCFFYLNETDRAQQWRTQLILNSEGKFDLVREQHNGTNWGKVDLRTLEGEEYIGLPDKNGKEISEGDIWVVYSQKNKDKELIRIIVEMDLSQGVFCEWRSSQGEVIGNIHQNPEGFK